MTVGKKMKIGIIVAVVAVLVMTAVDVATLPQSNGPNDWMGRVKVVAAENLWGSLVSQNWPAIPQCGEHSLRPQRGPA